MFNPRNGADAAAMIYVQLVITWLHVFEIIGLRGCFNHFPIETELLNTERATGESGTRTRLVNVPRLAMA